MKKLYKRNKELETMLLEGGPSQQVQSETVTPRRPAGEMEENREMMAPAATDRGEEMTKFAKTSANGWMQAPFSL